MNRFLPLIKRIVYPALGVAAHQIAENWQPIVSALGPHFAWLAGPSVVAIAMVILHELQPPTGGAQ